MVVWNLPLQELFLDSAKERRYILRHVRHSTESVTVAKNVEKFDITYSHCELKAKLCSNQPKMILT